MEVNFSLNEIDAAAKKLLTDAGDYKVFAFHGDMGAGKTTFIHALCEAMNITDVAYQNHLSRLKYTEENVATGRAGVFNMGRNFSIKLNVPLSLSLGK